MPNVCVDIYTKKTSPYSVAESPYSAICRYYVEYVFMDGDSYEFMDGENYVFVDY